MKRFVLILLVLLVATGTATAQTADFENLTLEDESYWNGSEGEGEFVSGGMNFNNNFNEEYNSWDGFAYSNLTDTEADGFTAQYNAIAGEGANQSEVYAIGYWSSFSEEPPTITLPSEQVVTGFYITNSNYAYYSMLNGDAFAKKFTDQDRLEVVITGYDGNGDETGKKTAYLAQYGILINEWEWIDLSGLGAVKTIKFAMKSTDEGEFGMNTPAYFCLDDFNGTPPKKSGGGSSGGCFISVSGLDSLSH